MPVNLADFTFIQYPAREQAELRVRIKILGVWFQGLSVAERSVKYEAEACMRLLGDFAAKMSPEVLELYVFIHYNFSYEWLRPTTQEIVDAYLATYGPGAMADDNSSDDEVDEAAADEGDADDEEAADAPAAVGAPHA